MFVVSRKDPFHLPLRLITSVRSKHSARGRGVMEEFYSRPCLDRSNMDSCRCSSSIKCLPATVPVHHVPSNWMRKSHRKILKPLSLSSALITSLRDADQQREEQVQRSSSSSSLGDIESREKLFVRLLSFIQLFAFCFFLLSSITDKHCCRRREERNAFIQIDSCSFSNDNDPHLMTTAATKGSKTLYTESPQSFSLDQQLDLIRCISQWKDSFGRFSNSSHSFRYRYTLVTVAQRGTNFSSSVMSRSFPFFRHRLSFARVFLV